MGVLTMPAILMARLAASPSTSGGRESGWPSGPVMPILRSFCCRCQTSSPFSACTVGMAPSSRQREKLATSCSSLHHDGALVGHEVLEAVDALVAHEDAHLLVHLIGPPGDGDVEGIVLARLLGPAAPLLVGLEQRGLGVGDDEIDDHGGAAGGSGGGAGEEVLARHRAHEGQLHMGVRIDAAGHDVLAAGVDGARALGYLELVADRLDDAVGAIDVGAIGLVGGDDRAAADHYGHRLCLPAVNLIVWSNPSAGGAADPGGFASNVTEPALDFRDRLPHLDLALCSTSLPR